MAAVDPVFAQWLQAEGLWEVTSDDDVATAWGTVAQTTARMTTLADKADAATEAARQLAFLGLPLAIDEHTMAGAWRAYLGRVITVTGPHLGYETGIDVFVIGASDDLATGLSTVTVIRRL